jgi:hypothetical protein
VLLAIVVLALTIGAPDRLHSQLMPNVGLMRVALIELGEQPESRQFRAIRRTDELNRSRDLLDTRGTDDTVLAGPTIALLANRSDSDPETNNYETDLNLQSPAAPVPLDVGTSPSVQAVVAIHDEKQPVGTQEEKPAVVTLEEKPVAIQEEKPTVTTPHKKSAVTRTPRRVKSRNESRAKGIQHVRIRARAPVKQESPSPQYLFDPFGSQQTGQTSTVNNTNYFGYQQPRQALTPSAKNYFGNQRPGQTQSPNTSDY